MPTPDDFLKAATWSGYLTIAIAILMVLGFVFSWGIRFRLVGSTGFMIVLTAGLFALTLMPLTRTVIPGAVRFSTVFDSGATQAVIVVPSTITEPELVATLQQAAADLFTPGRLGRGQNQLTIIARTVLHPQPGLSQPLVLGIVKRSLFDRNDDNMELEVYADRLAQLPKEESES
jgi:hypothetical protein